MPTAGVSLPVLFDQLGLPSEQAAVNAFLARHRPLAGDLALPEAPFWTASQRTFLHEALLEDSVWAGAVDELNRALHVAGPGRSSGSA